MRPRESTGGGNRDIADAEPEGPAWATNWESNVKSFAFSSKVVVSRTRRAYTRKPE
jgi:hypothetical protein